MPHMPQLSGSVIVSTHMPSHSSIGASQLVPPEPPVVVVGPVPPVDGPVVEPPLPGPDPELQSQGPKVPSSAHV